MGRNQEGKEPDRAGRWCAQRFRKLINSDSDDAFAYGGYGETNCVQPKGWTGLLVRVGAYSTFSVLFNMETIRR